MPGASSHTRREAHCPPGCTVGTQEECQGVAQGDGSFQRQCRNVPVYDERPVYDRWCIYNVHRWEFARSVKADSSGRNPACPDAVLAAGTDGVGEERTGGEHETYRVTVVANDGQRHTCKFEALDARWGFDVGRAVTFERYIIGGADCDTLTPAD